MLAFASIMDLLQNLGLKPHSPDTNILDFCLLGHLKDLLYVTYLHQECLQHKPLVLQGPTDKIPKNEVGRTFRP